MEFQFQGARRQLGINVFTQQADRTVTGTWTVTTAGNDTNGEVRGTLDGVGAETRFRGTVTWSSETATGTGRCLGTATFSGAAVPPVLTWTSPGWNFGATCSDPPQDVAWSIVRF